MINWRRRGSRPTGHLETAVLAHLGGWSCVGCVDRELERSVVSRHSAPTPPAHEVETFTRALRLPSGGERLGAAQKRHCEQGTGWARPRKAPGWTSGSFRREAGGGQTHGLPSAPLRLGPPPRRGSWPCTQDASRAGLQATPGPSVERLPQPVRNTAPRSAVKC